MRFAKRVRLERVRERARNSCNDPYKRSGFIRPMGKPIAKTIVHTSCPNVEFLSYNTHIGWYLYLYIVELATQLSVIVNLRMRTPAQAHAHAVYSERKLKCFFLLQLCGVNKRLGARIFQLKISCCLIDAKFSSHLST